MKIPKEIMDLIAEKYMESFEEENAVSGQSNKIDRVTHSYQHSERGRGFIYIHFNNISAAETEGGDMIFSLNHTIKLEINKGRIYYCISDEEKVRLTRLRQNKLELDHFVFRIKGNKGLSAKIGIDIDRMQRIVRGFFTCKIRDVISPEAVEHLIRGISFNAANVYLSIDDAAYNSRINRIKCGELKKIFSHKYALLSDNYYFIEAQCSTEFYLNDEFQYVYNILGGEGGKIKLPSLALRNESYFIEDGGIGMIIREHMNIQQFCECGNS